MKSKVRKDQYLKFKDKSDLMDLIPMFVNIPFRAREQIRLVNCS